MVRKHTGENSFGFSYHAEVLGHENISTTRRYARTAQEAIMELAAKPDRVEETMAIYKFLMKKVYQC
ncbi:hypothetical protein [Desulfotruncus alcoholivorax]|uniref:hypothetical protein n=1 Tax=Desulfotruncus alcoholivorax TaxID=265477 RepID=UPI0003FE1456|nr:hypothetical protein [Desulfotruncus alcoholivorax]